MSRSSSHQVMASPIPLSEIETVLAWVDSYKLSRMTKKIHRDFSDGAAILHWIDNNTLSSTTPKTNEEMSDAVSKVESLLAWVDSHKLSRTTKNLYRDFSDAVLLAEILSHHYPKLVEMHNYPPRNSHALKLNNWNTLNRKVLKKLKVNVCSATLEQLAGSTPGVIERILISVREKIKRDEEINSTTEDTDKNMSSGGSYYEACGEDENVLVVPLKTRVNGVLEIVQQKVVCYDGYMSLKEEMKDAKETIDMLKQKVEHFDNLMKLKDERIEELQKQLERKQSRRNVTDGALTINTINLPVPLDENLPSPKVESRISSSVRKTQSLKDIDENPKINQEEFKRDAFSCKGTPKTSITDIVGTDSSESTSVDIVKSDVFKDSSADLKPKPGSGVFQSRNSVNMVTISDVQNEIPDIVRSGYPEVVNCN